MDFQHFIKRFLLIFGILAQSLAYWDLPKDNALVKSSSKYHLIPTVILLTITLYTSVSCFFYQYIFMRGFGLANSFVANCLITCQMVTNLIVIAQTILHRQNMIVILRKLEKINDILRDEMGFADISFATFQRSYLKKAALSLIAFIVSCIALVLLRMTMGDLITSGHFYILLFFTHVSSMHTVFYLDLLRFLMNVLTRYVGRSADVTLYIVQHKKCNVKISVVNVLRYCQFTHLKLWQVSRLIVQQFGWSMAGTHLQWFFIISYSVYWMWIFGSSATNQILIIRKYKFNLLFFGYLVGF